MLRPASPPPPPLLPLPLPLPPPLLLPYRQGMHVSVAQQQHCHRRRMRCATEQQQQQQRRDSSYGSRCVNFVSVRVISFMITRDFFCPSPQSFFMKRMKPKNFSVVEVSCQSSYNYDVFPWQITNCVCVCFFPTLPEP